MEAYSRFRWVQLKGLDLSSTAVTGIQGSSTLGLNWAQLVWRALNSYDDQREEAERNWENAKFIGSCFAGKGLSKVYNQDINRRRKEIDTRQARKESLLRHVVMGEPLETEGTRKGDQVIIVAKTVEQLADQLEKSLRGEKDYHDEVVTAYENNVRKRERDRLDRLQQIAEAREVEYGKQGITSGSDMEGLTGEQVRERVGRKRQLEAQRAASSVVYPDDERREMFLDKWGMLGGEDPPEAKVVEAPQGRVTGKPFSR
jgi:hypothetical protein